MMGVDVLSDVLKSVRLTGAVFFDVAAKSPWVAEQPSSDLIIPRILPGAGHLISFHVVTQGRCFANILGETPVIVEAGEVIVFTNGDPHVMASGPGMRAEPYDRNAIDFAALGQLPFLLNFGGAGATDKIVCGFLACDAWPFNPLIENLPSVMKAKASPDGRDWLGEFVRFAMMESSDKRAGGESVLARLSELMFIEVVRRHLESLPPDQKGWLSGLRDPLVSKALSAMHGRPTHPWTIEELGRCVGMSRSLLAERFMSTVGLPPMQYLAKWRMQLASGLLSSGTVNISTIAEQAGYASEASFSRAFRKIVGVPPSKWRSRTLEKQAP